MALTLKRGDRRLHWLRRLLLIKTLFCWVVWGPPALIGPGWFLELFGLTLPADPVYLRLVGALVVAVGLIYYLGYRDPVRNVVAVYFGVIDNALATVTLLVVGFTAGLSSWFLWVTVGLTALFTLAFVALLPAARRAA
jgi:hypothetical protein